MQSKNETTYNALNCYTKLMRAAESVTSRTSRHMGASDLTISQFGVLEALLHKGSLCQRDIAAKILKSTGNMTLVIDNLEKRNLVRRERDSQDRRYLTVHLTDEGTALITEVYTRVEAAIISEMSVLSTDEQQTLGRLSKKLGLQAGEST
jgi:MarR family 2-MHQ and catechol resistance regulon transcriptional repressor